MAATSQPPGTTTLYHTTRNNSLSIERATWAIVAPRPDFLEFHGSCGVSSTRYPLSDREIPSNRERGPFSTVAEAGYPPHRWERRAKRYLSRCRIRRIPRRGPVRR